MVSMQKAAVNVMLSVAKHPRHGSFVDSRCVIDMDSSPRLKNDGRRLDSSRVQNDNDLSVFFQHDIYKYILL